MNANDAIKALIEENAWILEMYLADLSDADLLARPTPKANHIAWQLGHLVAGEVEILGKLPGANYPALPEGFAKAHSNETSTSDDASLFLSKAEYLNLAKSVRAATIELLSKQSAEDLDKPNTGSMKEISPTIGRLFITMANHTMMHAGQFTVVRRYLNKPVAF